jgi:microcystin-dependent protein
MSDQYVGEIRSFPFNFAPAGWAQCQGQLLSISQNTALFSLVGTFYGGDGQSTFALPNLQGNVVVDQGNLTGGQDYIIGETGGLSQYALNGGQSAAHSHNVIALNAPGTSSHPTGNLFAEAEYQLNPEPLYDSTSTGTLAYAALQPSGSNQPHTNLQPYLVINYCIALNGVYPTRQ